MKLSLSIIIVLFAVLICTGQTAFEYYNIGLVKYHLRDYRGAISDFNKALDINTKYITAYNLRGASKYQIGDYTGAIADYNKAIELNPGLTGTLKFSLRESGEDFLNTDDINLINPEYAFSYFNRGLARQAIKDYKGATDDYSKAIEINPGLKKAYYNRGHSRHKMYDMYGACRDWRKAADMGHSDAHEAVIEYCRYIDP